MAILPRRSFRYVFAASALVIGDLPFVETGNDANMVATGVRRFYFAFFEAKHFGPVRYDHEAVIKVFDTDEVGVKSDSIQNLFGDSHVRFTHGRELVAWGIVEKRDRRFAFLFFAVHLRSALDSEGDLAFVVFVTTI